MLSLALLLRLHAVLLHKGTDLFRAGEEPGGKEEIGSSKNVYEMLMTNSLE